MAAEIAIDITKTFPGRPAISAKLAYTLQQSTALVLFGPSGSGKTTTAAKLGRRLQNRDKQKVLMASLDTRRPAAQEQLRVLGEQTGVAALPVIEGQNPAAITRRALQAAKLGGYDVLMLDTAGRLHVDDVLMQEVAAVRDAVQPHETLLVADSLTGQDAVKLARSFDERWAALAPVHRRTLRGSTARLSRALQGRLRAPLTEAP